MAKQSCESVSKVSTQDKCVAEADSREQGLWQQQAAHLHQKQLRFASLKGCSVEWEQEHPTDEDAASEGWSTTVKASDPAGWPQGFQTCKVKGRPLRCAVNSVEPSSAAWYWAEAWFVHDGATRLIQWSVQLGANPNNKDRDSSSLSRHRAASFFDSHCWTRWLLWPYESGH